MDATADLAFQHLLIVGKDHFQHHVFLSAPDELSVGSIRVVERKSPFLHNPERPSVQWLKKDLLPGRSKTDEQIRRVIASGMPLLFHNFAIGKPAEKLEQIRLFGPLQHNLHTGNVVDRQDLVVSRDRLFFEQII